MKTIAIFVATTGGPARVERLTPEFAPQSMVCLRRGSDILPISGDYDDFVKRGSGVIEREFGPFDTASFRLDVAENIGTGKSWQLGVFAAHGVAASDQVDLAEGSSRPDVVVWLTGEVDYDLGVATVGHIAEKITASEDFFADWQAAGVPVLAIVPAGQNQAEMNAAMASGVEVLAVASAREIFAPLGLAAPAPPADSKQKKQSSGQLAAILGFVVLLAISGWAIGTDRLAGMMQNFKAPPGQKSLQKLLQQSPQQPAEQVMVKNPARAQAKPRPGLTIFARRPPKNATCAKVHFGRVEAATAEIKITGDSAFARSPKQGLCGLKFVFTLGKTSRFIAAELEIESGAFVRGNARPKILSGITKATGLQSWTVNVPRRLAEPLKYNLTAIIGKQPAAAELVWFKKQNDRKQAIATLAKKGFMALTWRHQITP